MLIAHLDDLFLLPEIQHRLFRLLQAKLELLELILEKCFGVRVCLEALVEIGGNEGVSIGLSDLLRAHGVRIRIGNIDEPRADDRVNGAVAHDDTGGGLLIVHFLADLFGRRRPGKDQSFQEANDRELARRKERRILAELQRRCHSLGHGTALQQLVLGSHKLDIGAFNRGDIAALDDLGDVAVNLQADARRIKRRLHQGGDGADDQSSGNNAQDQPAALDGNAQIFEQVQLEAGRPFDAGSIAAGAVGADAIEIASGRNTLRRRHYTAVFRIRLFGQIGAIEIHDLPLIARRTPRQSWRAAMQSKRYAAQLLWPTN